MSERASVRVGGRRAMEDRGVADRLQSAPATQLARPPDAERVCRATSRDTDRLLGGQVSESGRLCHGDGATSGVPTAGGRSCCLSSRRYPQSFPFECRFWPSRTLAVTSTCERYFVREFGALEIAWPPNDSVGPASFLGRVGGSYGRRWSIVSGNVKVKVEPVPGSLFTQILPPWSSMNLRDRASPSPVPSAFLSAVPTCRNSSNTAS